MAYVFRIAVALACAGLITACNGDPPTSPTVDEPAPLLAVGTTRVCARHSSGTTYCWGDGITVSGDFGPGGGFAPTPRPTTLTDYTAFSRGSSAHLCAISEGGVARCWGRNSNGQVGSGIVGGFRPRETVAGGVDWVEIATGRISTCGVSRSGAGYCWGSNNAGEIGAEAVTVGVNSPAPTPVEGGLTFRSVVTGWRHACGITTAGATYCWGENTRGQLGVGTADSDFRRTPVLVGGNHAFVQLSLGGRHTCGLTSAGTALCWGDNSTGQLGDGSVLPRSLPTAVAGSLTFRLISTSDGFADSAGVPLPNATQGGTAHTCALTTAGTAYCWGWSAVGQVGNPSATIFQVTPLQVSGGLTLSTIGVGGAFTCGARGDAVWCWGVNTKGQLGDGGIANSPVPKPVSAPFTTP